MKKELRDKWVAALRSGEYKQVVGSLKTNDGYCCLGVLCEVANIEQPGPRLDGRYLFYDSKNMANGAILMDNLLMDLGVTSDFNRVFTSMNDNERRSFDYIADYIEKFVKVED